MNAEQARTPSLDGRAHGRCGGTYRSTLLNKIVPDGRRRMRTMQVRADKCDGCGEVLYTLEEAWPWVQAVRHRRSRSR